MARAKFRGSAGLWRVEALQFPSFLPSGKPFGAARSGPGRAE